MRPIYIFPAGYLYRCSSPSAGPRSVGSVSSSLSKVSLQHRFRTLYRLTLLMGCKLVFGREVCKWLYPNTCLLLIFNFQCLMAFRQEDPRLEIDKALVVFVHSHSEHASQFPYGSVRAAAPRKCRWTVFSRSSDCFDRYTLSRSRTENISSSRWKCPSGVPAITAEANDTTV